MWTIYRRRGETILAKDFRLVPGGKGANQAYALGRMGADIAMLGAVGRDAYGDMVLANLSAAGVDGSQIARLDAQTGMALISVDAGGRNQIVVAPGANSLVTVDYIQEKRKVLQQADLIVMQLEIPLSTVEYVAQTAKSMGKTVVLDPAPAPGPLPDSLLQHIDYMKPNESELQALTGTGPQDVEQAVAALLRKGVGCVLASLGSKGVRVEGTGRRPTHYPCADVPVVDTTAAGDSFLAAFVSALARGKNLDRAVRFANAVATVVVTREGAQSSIPDREEILQIWRDLR